ncbi:MAG TPA: hypothetical protein VIW94_11755, partial [Acidimicrobiia bacterium]
MKRYVRVIALLGVLTLVLAACGDGDGGDSTTTVAGDTTTTVGEDTTTTAGEETTTTLGETAEAVVTCLVTDLAGVDDRSFNAAAWQGVLDAVDAGGAAADPLLLESDAQD